MPVPEDSLNLAVNRQQESFDQVALEPPRVGGDEMNLAEFPFTLLSDRQPPGLNTIQFSDTIRGKDGQQVQRTWIVTGGEEFGLPVASDEQVYVALMEITREQGYAHRVIHVTRYELIKRLGWPEKGGSYKRLKGALDRLLGVTITAKQAFWDKVEQSYVDVGFHIIDDYALYSEPRGRKPTGPRRPKPLSYISWNEIIFQSFQAGNIKQLDTGFYFGLHSAVSRRLFRYLDKKRLDGKPAFRIGLHKLGFEKLGMSRRYYPSHIKQELRRAHDELIANGFLRGFKYYRPGRDTDERVIYWFPGARPPSADDTPLSPPADLLSALDALGMTASVARRLLADHGAEVARQLDYLPYRSPHDPPAMLVEAIRGQWAAPASYLKTRAQQEEARREAQAELQRHQQRQEELEKRAAALEACRRKLASLSPTERAQIESASRQQLEQDNPALAAHPDSTTYEVVLLDYIATLLQDHPDP